MRKVLGVAYGKGASNRPPRGAARVPSAAVIGAALICLLSAGAACAETPGFGVEARLKYAAMLEASGQYGLCAVEYSKLMAERGGPVPAGDLRLRLAECQSRSGDYASAAQNFRLFAAENGGSPLAAEAARRAVEAGAKAELGGKRLVRSSPEGRKSNRARLKAVQVHVFDSLDPAALDAEMARLRAAGVNAVIARVFHNRGDRYHGKKRAVEAGVYFRTGAAPVVADALGPVIRAAHANGLRVFAWMTTKYADYGVEGDRSIACVGYDARSGKLSRCAGLDLFNEAAVRRLEAIYRDLAAYEIDGVLFQDDLVLRSSEGFGPAASALFKKETGGRLDPAVVLAPSGPDGGRGGQFRSWSAWKNRRLLDVADRLKSAVRSGRPAAEFAINLMYEAVTDPGNALAWFSQSIDEAASRGYDYYSVMAYHRQMGSELGMGAEELEAVLGSMAAAASRAAGGPERVLMKFQTVDWESGAPLPEREVAAMLSAVERAEDGVSVALAPYRADLALEPLGAFGAAGRRQ